MVLPDVVSTWEDEMFGELLPLEEAVWLLEVVYPATGDHGSYYDVPEDERCLAEEVDGFGVPY